MAIRPWEKKGTLEDYIRLYSDIGPAYVQGTAIAAALTKAGIVQPTRKRGPCFKCGRPGRFAKDCRASPGAKAGLGVEAPTGPRAPGLCPRCQRGKHWAKECRSQTHRDGTPLSGNFLWGPPRPRQTIGAVTICPPQSVPKSLGNLSICPPQTIPKSFMKQNLGPVSPPCSDLSASSRYVLTPGIEPQALSTGVFGPLPPGTAGLILGRSSVSMKGLTILPGIVDADYEGEIKIMAYTLKKNYYY